MTDGKTDVLVYIEKKLMDEMGRNPDSKRKKIQLSIPTGRYLIIAGGKSVKLPEKNQK